MGIDGSREAGEDVAMLELQAGGGGQDALDETRAGFQAGAIAELAPDPHAGTPHKPIRRESLICEGIQAQHPPM